MDTDKVGKFIAGRRKICGLTQQELADELGITNKAVSKWETGQGMPDITILPVLSDILGISVDELLSGECLETQKENDEKIAEVNRVIYWFRAAAYLSMFFALIGVIVPFFMVRETTVIGSLLFGCWWTICSTAVFFVLYFRMKNVIDEYNIKALQKMNPRRIRNQVLRFELWIWLLVPSRLIIHFISALFTVRNTAAQAAGALILTILVGMLVWVKCIGKKATAHKWQYTRKD